VSPYAERTTVAPEKSRAEIERTLSRFGATAFMYGWNGDAAVIQFKMQETFGYRQVRFVLPMPQLEEFRLDRRSYLRSESAKQQAWEQEVRRRWRSLALSIKAKLDAVETGLFTFDQEFMPFIVLPDGRTTGEWLVPQLDEAYTSGEMPTEMRLAIAQTAGDGR
jgi:hypothetical protein